LDRQTYPNSKVVDLAQKFIPVKINVDKQPEVARKYNVSGIPVILFLDASGKVLHNVEGFLPPEEFAKEMRTALGKGKK
jgi:thioredoxin-related protein